MCFLGVLTILSPTHIVHPSFPLAPPYIPHPPLLFLGVKQMTVERKPLTPHLHKATVCPHLQKMDCSQENICIGSDFLQRKKASGAAKEEGEEEEEASG